MKVSELHLQPDVQAKVEALLAAHPGTIFTSGRRTLGGQAEAMSQNIIAGGRHWITSTYTDSPAVRALQHWVDSHPNARNHLEIAAGLLSVMKEMPEAEQNSISHHLTGRALDIQPGSCPISAIEALGPRKILLHEGGLRKIHVEF
jgi:hypothetical protein